MSNSSETPQAPLRITLDPPIRCGGQKYTELTFDFGSLTAKDFAEARLTAKALFGFGRKKFSLSTAEDLYLCVILAQAANDGTGSAAVPVGLIRKLPRHHYRALHDQLRETCGKAIEDYLDKAEEI